MCADADRASPGPDDRLTPVLRPVRAGNGFEEALEQILQVVRLGLVPGGERLPAERELAERLGISRVTLREVLKVLQDQGLVESQARPVRRHVRAAPRRRPDGEDELRRRIGGRSTSRTSCASARSWRSGAAGLCAAHGLDGERADRLRDGAGARPRTRRWPTTAAWTPCSTSPSPSCPVPRRSTAQYAAVRATRQRPAGLHPAAGAQPGALAAPAHGAGRGGARRRRGRGPGDDARALRGDGGAAARLPGVNPRGHPGH